MSEHACITVGCWMMSYGFEQRHIQQQCSVSSLPHSQTPFSREAWGCGSPPTVTADVWKPIPKLKLFPEVARAATIKLAVRQWEKQGEKERASGQWRREERPDQQFYYFYYKKKKVTSDRTTLLLNAPFWLVRKRRFMLCNGLSDSSPAANHSFYIKGAARASHKPLNQ